MGEDTGIKSDDLPKPVRKWRGFFKWLGGIAAIPLLMLLGNFVIGQAEDAVEHVSDIDKRLTVVEGNVSSKEAIWQAIAKNREDQTNTKDDLAKRFNAMAVKYEATMLLFEKHFLGGCEKKGVVAMSDDNALMVEMLHEMLDEVKKAEETDKSEIERLKKELDKFKSKAQEQEDIRKQQEEFLRNLKNAQAPQVQQKIDPKQFRQSYEQEFPIQKGAPEKK